MEPITHFLTGAVISRAGLNRTTALATVTLVLAAEAPDVDVVAYLGGDVFGFAHHRGITHTFLGTPFVAALVIATVFIGYRARESLQRRLRRRAVRHSSASGNPRWGLLFIYACIAVLSHILLDFTNNYGVRPLLPFHDRWYSWDIVFIVEPLLYVVFLAGLLLPGLFGLVHEEIGVRPGEPRGRVGAIAALIAMVAIWGVRDYEHRRALAVLNSRLYHGEPPLRVSAYPYYVNPFKWYAVVETRPAFERMIVDSFTPEVDPQAKAQIRYKPEETPASKAARESYLGRVYLGWAQYPVLETQALEKPNPGFLVRFRDLRFLYPERQGSPLTAYELLNSDLQVVRAWFGGAFSRDDDAVSGIPPD